MALERLRAATRLNQWLTRQLDLARRRNAEAVALGPQPPARPPPAHLIVRPPADEDPADAPPRDIFFKAFADFHAAIYHKEKV